MGKCESTRLDVRRVIGLTATKTHILISDDTNSALDCMDLPFGVEEGFKRIKVNIMMLAGATFQSN